MTYLRPCIIAMKGYVPGMQPPEKEKYIKLNSNENPYPPSPRVAETLQKISYQDLRFYPDPLCHQLREKLGELYGLAPEQIICGNGSDDVLNIIVRTFLQPGEAMAFYEPTFPLYRVLGIIHGAEIIALPLAEPSPQLPEPPLRAKVFFLANPNSPLGYSLSLAQVSQLAKKVHGILVVDEAYAEFAKENALSLLTNFKNVIIVRTVSKSYSLAGVRLGYALGPVELIKEMFKVKDPFNVNQLTQKIVLAALGDREYYQRNIARIVATRDWFSAEARQLGYKIIPSQANFIFPQPPRKGEGRSFYQYLYEKRILTRFFDEEMLKDGVRMTIGTQEEMEFTLQVMHEIIKRY
ncbi:MAG: histidinol-phosphate transaminase [Thermodesulfobacteriota bacterium]